jgi:hypothetical protein
MFEIINLVLVGLSLKGLRILGDLIATKKRRERRTILTIAKI